MKNPVKAAEVTTKYVDTEGNKISDEVVKTGNIGDDYNTEQKAIEGYTFKEIKGNATGTFTADAQNVTYVYTKNEDSDGSKKPDGSKGSEGTKILEKPSSNENKHNNGEKLPQTGENTFGGNILMMFGSVMVTVVAWIFKKNVKDKRTSNK